LHVNWKISQSMALTPSNMLELGTKAPDFILPDVTTQRMVDFAGVAGSNGTLVMFICNHCPYVVHVQDELVRICADFQGRQIGFVAISSNDTARYPDDAPLFMAQQAARVGFQFPYLYDEDQQVAQAYHAACTPDFYLFDGDGILVYRGRLDESRPTNGIPVTGKDIRHAIENLLNGKEQADVQYPSMGCGIKWKGM